MAEPVQQLLARLGPLAIEYGEVVLKWANPDIDRSLNPLSDWPLMRADHAFAVALAYILFVVFMPMVVKIIFGSDPVSVAKGSDGKPVKFSVMQKFSNEPLLFPLMIVYNATQVALCGWMVYASIQHYRQQNYAPICNAFNPRESGMAKVLWVFYVSKVLDFMDTVFMIFRRKWTQLSFLHVYHHTSIFLVYWVNINVAYDGDIYYTIVANGFIHFIMYFYYLVTTFNVKVPQFVKKMITNMQLIQFVTMNLQAFYILYNKCPFPNNFTWFYLFYIQSLFWLFTDFKNKAYKKKEKSNDVKKTN